MSKAKNQRGASASTKLREVWCIEIQHPLDGRWTRVGRLYREKATARSWVSFVRAYWHGAKARVVKLKLEKSEGA